VNRRMDDIFRRMIERQTDNRSPRQQMNEDGRSAITGDEILVKWRFNFLDECMNQPFSRSLSLSVGHSHIQKYIQQILQRHPLHIKPAADNNK